MAVRSSTEIFFRPKVIKKRFAILVGGSVVAKDRTSKAHKVINRLKRRISHCNSTEELRKWRRKDVRSSIGM